ncbi:MAG: signal peptidase II [Clostridia bacterium]|nr:signal peptidase II [Clostridia bacterium]
MMYSLTIALGILLDRISKLLAVEFLKKIDTLPLIENVFHFTYVENRGAAFGMMSDQRWLFIVASTVAIIGFSLYLYLGHADSSLFGFAIALVISGGIGNMIDRLSLGYVVDFIHCKFVKYPVFSDFGIVWREFPVFNIADSFVCVGAGLLIFVLIREFIKESKNAKKSGSK